MVVIPSLSGPGMSQICTMLSFELERTMSLLDSAHTIIKLTQKPKWYGQQGSIHKQTPEV